MHFLLGPWTYTHDQCNRKDKTMHTDNRVNCIKTIETPPKPTKQSIKRITVPTPCFMAKITTKHTKTKQLA